MGGLRECVWMDGRIGIGWEESKGDREQANMVQKEK